MNESDGAVRVTKEQYEFFRALYDEEERTAQQLEARAKVYIGVVSAFLAAIIFKAGDAKTVAETLRVPWYLLLGEAPIMTAALLLILRALHIRDYEAVNDGLLVIDSYAEGWPKEEDFYEDRSIDYAVASSRNRDINQEVATQLQWGSWTIFAGILYLFTMLSFAIWRAK